jgi:hypothetical protein
MKYLFLATGIIVALAFAVLTWGPLAKAPTPPQRASAAVQQPTLSAPEPPPAPPPIPQPVSYPQQPPPPVDMPNTSTGARQSSTEAAEPMPVHRRPHRPVGEQAAPVNTAVANGFTADLNRQEVESLQSGGRTPHGPWRELSPPP